MFIDHPGVDWPQYLRLRDLFQLLDEWPDPRPKALLEIGCGDGLLSSSLADYFEKVVPTEINPRAKFPSLIKADAQKLPFSGNSFDAIFSSNVLEHIVDLDACLNELYRVSTNDVTMVHTMPTIWWKSLQFITHPMHLSRSLVRKFRRRRTHSPACNSRQVSTNRSDRSLTSTLKPTIHGVSKSHLDEFGSFKTNWWESRFNSNGFIVVKKTELFFHSPYRLFPYKFMKVRNALAKTYFPCVTAYWVKKKVRN